MTIRNGYSAFPRRSAWAVSWKDGTGVRREKGGIVNEQIAHEFGRKQAAMADRVRLRIISPAEATAQEAAMKPIVDLVVEWGKALAEKGNTLKHVSDSIAKVNRVLYLTGIDYISSFHSSKIQHALASIARHRTPQTAHHHLVALNSFVLWCINTDRLMKNPLAGVKAPKAAGAAFRWVVFDAGMLEALLAVSGDRAMLYRLLANTGLRISEAASLAPGSFKTVFPDAIAVSVCVDASISKHRERDEIPIPIQFGVKLGRWVDDRSPCPRLFPNCNSAKSLRQFKADCGKAGIVAHEGERLGFNCLRRFYITTVVRAGGLAAGSQLARHKSLAMTRRYVDLSRPDLDKALAGLPTTKEPTKINNLSA